MDGQTQMTDVCTHSELRPTVPVSKIATQSDEQFKTRCLKWALVAGLTYTMLLAVGIVGSGFKTAAGGPEGAAHLFAFATNPFLGLIVGICATALVQSSSTVTSIIVGLVAGGLPIAMAIPMVMGANVGTTITNTLVSLGHVREKSEFRRAFSAATVHDFFNLMAVAIFLPLEIGFGFLQKASSWLAQMFVGGSSMSMSGFNFIKPITKPAISSVQNSLSFLPDVIAGIAMVAIGIGLIFVAISMIGKILRTVMVGRAKKILHAAMGQGPLSGIASGTAVTILVQSSSTTTSLAVPLAGSGIFTTRQIYPFTLGANIGTCVTALLAATAISTGNAQFALQIALVHLLYNTAAVIVIFGVPALRELPLKSSEWLAHLASEKKIYALAYILAVFFVLPALAVGVSALI